MDEFYAEIKCIHLGYLAIKEYLEKFSSITQRKLRFDMIVISIVPSTSPLSVIVPCEWVSDKPGPWESIASKNGVKGTHR